VIPEFEHLKLHYQLRIQLMSYNHFYRSSRLLGMFCMPQLVKV